MKKFNVVVASILLSTTLAACVNTAGAPQIGVREGIGTVAGGALGAAAGSQIGRGDTRLIATAIGAVIGASIGREFGAQLDEVARRNMAAATERAVITGDRIEWESPRARGYSQPVREGRTASGAQCREVEMTVIIDGRPDRAYTTACRDHSGRWQITS